MDTLQPQLTTIICGDFNTRIGHRTPHLDFPHPARTVSDTFTCQRATWFIKFCEKYDLYILNGIHSPAAYTCHTGRGESIVDYVLCNKVFLQVQQINLQQHKLSDHDLLYTHLPLKNGNASQAISSPTPQTTDTTSCPASSTHSSPTTHRKMFY